MADYTSETIAVELRRHILPTPWPHGATLGELLKMIAAVETSLGNRTSDDAAWVIPEDDQVVIYSDPKGAVGRGLTPKGTPAAGLSRLVRVVFHWDPRHGPCHDCDLPAAFRLGDASGEKLCAVCAANHAADGQRIIRIDSGTAPDLGAAPDGR